MKKLASLLLGLTVVFSLVACGKCSHNYVYATCTTPKECIKCGERSGEVLGHSWVEATCTSPKTCSRCSMAEGLPLGHNYKNGECTYCYTNDPNNDSTSTQQPQTSTQPNKIYHIGETWVVDNQWELTINSVTNHHLCNPIHNEDKNYTDEQVILIDYTYKNIGYTGNIQDLYISATSFDVYDQDGESADMYACTHDNPPKVCAIGTKCTAKESFVLKTNSSKIKLIISEYTSNGLGRVKATFELDIGQHTHSFSSWETTKNTTCTEPGTKERHCSCGKSETQTIAQKAHDFKNGKCSSCGTSDPNYKTPDLILGEHVQKTGKKQSDGKYVVSFYPYSNDKSTITQIYWNPADKSLIFAEQSSTALGVTTAGIIFEYGALNTKQKITFINDQTSTGYKITGIGYIYANIYTSSYKGISSYTCDASGSLAKANKDLAETAILMLVSHIDDYLDINTDIDVKDSGFVSWTW